jgi:glycosyltransferase involved in cell wall biosynthesis
MINKKKLLLINGTQFGYSAGHYFYCKYLSGDFTIRYICYDRGLNRLSLKGTDVHYVSFKGNKLIRTIRFIKESIIQSYSVKPNVLIVAYFNICLLLALFCRSKKRVLDIRSGSLKKNKFFRSIGNFFILFQSLFFDEAIILSESLRKKLSVSGKKSIIVPLGSEIFFTGEHNYNSLSLFYVGSLNNRNIIETIIGLHLFLKTNEGKKIEVNYSIVGFGSPFEIAKIMNCIADLGLSDSVTYVGRKTNEELIPYFEHSNIGIVFVPRTPWYDCQPVTKLFEYTLSGMPVIATNTYENSRIVNKTNGVLIDDTSEDFCKGLLIIYNNRNSFNSADIRRTVESFTWANIINNTLKPFLERIA